MNFVGSLLSTENVLIAREVYLLLLLIVAAVNKLAATDSAVMGSENFRVTVVPLVMTLKTVGEVVSAVLSNTSMTWALSALAKVSPGWPLSVT